MAFIDDIKQYQGKPTILDHGCGTGRVAKFITDNLFCNLIINDISNIAIHNTIKLLGYKVQNFCGHLEEMEPPTTKFDFLISHRVLHTIKTESLQKTIQFIEQHSNKIFISARSKSCQEYEHALANYQQIKQDEFLSLNNKYIHFFDEESLINIFSIIKITELGYFTELSGIRNKENTYIYIIAETK
jgi:2-polyprenyl-3-methyl-5-hydroxy-6-metoxy-1,4-benzoquinol methylase